MLSIELSEVRQLSARCEDCHSQVSKRIDHEASTFHNALVRILMTPIWTQLAGHAYSCIAALETKDGCYELQAYNYAHFFKELELV